MEVNYVSKKIQITLAFLISLTMIFTFNIASFAETALDPSTTEEEQIIETVVEETAEEVVEVTVEKITKEVVEPVEKEGPEDETKQEDPVDVPQEGDPLVGDTDPPIAQPEVLDPIPQEPLQQLQTESLLVSLTAEVVTTSDTYTNGDEIEYEIILSNDGDLEIENIRVSDSWGINDSINIQPGGVEVLRGSLEIERYNLLEEMGNVIEIYTIYDEEVIEMELGFAVEVEIPRGSITIKNEVSDLPDAQQEFDVFITGYDGSKYVVTLGKAEEQTIENLWLGNYIISSTPPMNYKLISKKDDIVSIERNGQEVSVEVEHELNNTRWFYDSDTVTITGQTGRTPYRSSRANALVKQREECRYAEVSFVIEVEVPIIEVTIEQIMQPNDESEADIEGVPATSEEEDVAQEVDPEQEYGEQVEVKEEETNDKEPEGLEDPEISLPLEEEDEDEPAELTEPNNTEIKSEEDKNAQDNTNKELDLPKEKEEEPTIDE